MSTIGGICFIACIAFIGLTAFFVYALACAAAKADDELTKATGIDHRYH